MAKQDSKQDAGASGSGYPPLRRQAEEMQPEIIPPVEAPAPLTPQDMPSGTVGTVADSARAAASAQEAQSDFETSYVTTEATGVTREVKTPRGYAPAALPWGDRAATDEEIAKYKAAQQG